MKVNELMIGDWVRIKSDIEPDDAYWLHDMQPGQALKVTEMLSNGINPDWYGGEINDCVPEDAIEPIPLTAEILGKNKFSKSRLMGEQRHFTYYLASSVSLLAIYDAEFSLCIGDCARYIKYVHQLQHCLKLVGIEKEITL